MTLDAATGSIRARLLSKRQVTLDGCWRWTASLDRYGYGRPEEVAAQYFAAQEQETAA